MAHVCIKHTYIIYSKIYKQINKPIHVNKQYSNYTTNILLKSCKGWHIAIKKNVIKIVYWVFDFL